MNAMRQKSTNSATSKSLGNAFDKPASEADQVGKSAAPPAFQLKAGEDAGGGGGEAPKKAEGENKLVWNGMVLGGAIGSMANGFNGMLTGGLNGAELARQVQLLLTVGAKKAESMDDLRVILETIPTGREALQRMKDYGTTVVFEAGKGSFFSSETKTMTIDSTETVREAALTFVHEMNHAMYFETGLRQDILSATKADYIKGMVAEEAEGTVKSIEAKIELEGTIIDTKGLSFPLETEYRTAYKAAMIEADASGKTQAQSKAIARAAGTKAVVDGFMTGKVQTSNTGESYADYYGNAWDQNHPAGK